MIDATGQPKVLEFNCRFGDPETQPIMMRLQSDLVQHCLAACSGQLAQEQALWDDACAVGVVMAAGGYPDSVRTGDEILGLAAAAKLPGKVFHAGTRSDVDAEGRAIVTTQGGRVLCCTALGASVGAAQQAAYALVDRIHWAECRFRTDIGYRAIARESAN
jgi:phosphoribosylamine--glycine ligase